MPKYKRYLDLVWVLLFGVRIAQAGDFVPDPAAVQWEGTAYRYPQAGWIVLHIEGDPYQRGFQHGKLLAEEITAHLRSFAKVYSPKAPREGLDLLRTIGNLAFLRGFEREYLEEMQGIADGANEAGARIYGRALDLLDIATVNLWPEIMTLEWALKAKPTGLEGVKFPQTPSPMPSAPQVSRCSAFAATGPATADGKILFGHITMFMLYPSTFYNVWLDVQPSEGHRVVMQTYPGGIHSGMDYYISSAGILVAETTIDQTRFNEEGVPLASRIRKALQYGDSIDDVVEVLKTANNGLYTNEWLLADTKTNEIAMFELGTHATRLYRSSRNEWFGGTEGFYWGCNNTKDLAVRLETIPAANDRPDNLVWRPTDRDVAWVKLYQEYKGRMDESFAQLAFTTPPICKSSSVDAKFTTTKLAEDLRSWALFGPPAGKIWEPTGEELEDYEEIRPLVPNPWTLLSATNPKTSDRPSAAVDLSPTFSRVSQEAESRRDQWRPKASRTIWRGTILPATDGDLWLATAFADYHHIVEKEILAASQNKDRCLCSTDLDRSATSLYAARARYLHGTTGAGDAPIRKVRSAYDSNFWYHLASGKGVLVLNELRRTLGDEVFIEVMDSFGTAMAGKEVTSHEFVAHVEKKAGRSLSSFFDYWLLGTGLPEYRLIHAQLDAVEDGGQPSWRCKGKLAAVAGPLPENIEVTLESAAAGEKTKVVPLSDSGEFHVESADKPFRLIVDAHGRMAKANGGLRDIKAHGFDLEKTLIVVGTLDDGEAHHEAAIRLRDQLRQQGSNVAVSVVTDADATDDRLKDRHLILIGRPGTNRITDRVRDSLPAKFHGQSFVIRGKVYAHMNTGVILGARHPVSPGYSVAVFAGLSATATWRLVEARSWDDFGVEVKLFAHGQEPQRFVAPCDELTWEFAGAVAN